MSELLKTVLTDKTARNSSAQKAVAKASTSNMDPWS